MRYSRAGTAGLRLPAISLGLWHNFGGVDPHETARSIVLRAFDLGVTHLDLANNYGPPPGSAEETLGRILRRDLAGHRDELVIASKAGYRMGPGPYGDGGSRKYLVSSLEQSLVRLGVDYVDLFYHHRPDPETPLEETMGALAHLVRQGKALYVGLSNYPPELTRQAAALLREHGTPCVLHQPKYSMLERTIERGLLDVLAAEGIGCIAFSPLAQGLLTHRYLAGVPEGSRAAKPHGFLRPEHVDDALRAKLLELDALARGRGQSLAQLALAWVLRHSTVTSALVGASRPEQLEDAVATLDQPPLTAEELARVDTILSGEPARP